MPRLCIPEINDVLTLKKKWTFNLHAEDRNKTLFDLLGIYDRPAHAAAIHALTQELHHINYWSFADITGHTFNAFYIEQRKNKLSQQKYDELMAHDAVLAAPVRVTLPRATELIVDRVYIRKGAEAFSSITFRISACSMPELSKGKRRFWAKLAECNQMEIF